MFGGLKTAAPDDKALRPLRLGGHRVSWIYRFSRWTVGFVASVARGMVVEGIEHLPESGPLIVACNHVSLLDPPLLGYTVNAVRFPQIMAKQELFSFPPMGALFRRYGAIPLDRGRGDVGAMRRGVKILRDGGCILMFPEGTRFKPGKVRRIKPGVGLLARETGACVVPARIRNSESLFGPGTFRLRFGEPMRYDRGKDRQGCQAFAEYVMEMISKL